MNKKQLNTNELLVLNQLFSAACLIDFPTNQYALHPEDAIKITITNNRIF